jgi:hypothetical protein
MCAPTDSLLLFLVKPVSVPIDLSKTTKLKDVVFQPMSRSVKWVITTLKTTSKHRDLREISIYLPYSVATAGADADAGRIIVGENFGEWLDLDRLLVEFWESSSIRPKVVCRTRAGGERDTSHCVGYQLLLPEITRRGIIDLVEPRVF